MTVIIVIHIVSHKLLPQVLIRTVQYSTGRERALLGLEGRKRQTFCGKDVNVNPDPLPQHSLGQHAYHYYTENKKQSCTQQNVTH